MSATATWQPRHGRPTIYRGIPMRSRTEADVAQWLDATGRKWSYEPQCFASKAGQYLPDFRVEETDGSADYLEVKSSTYAPNDLDPVLRRMCIIWDSEPDAGLILILWDYVRHQPDDMIFNDGRQRHWWCSAPGMSHPAGWPGMGQLDALIEDIRRENKGSR